MGKQSITVLLVEDEPTLAMIITDTLTENGFIIHAAPDGEKGLRDFFQLRPDILVTDVMMPRMDGFEMVRRIRQTDKKTPVLFLTARSAINDVVKGFELGANDYLKKPFGMQELIIRIKALLGKAFDSAAEQTPSRFEIDRKSTRLNSSHANISYAVFCLKKNIQRAATENITCIFLTTLIRVTLRTVRHSRRFKIVVIDIQITLKQMFRDFIGIRVNRAKKSGMVNITSSVNSRERSGINTILHELNPLFTINVTMRDIKSKNVYSRVNSKATTQWRKTESANGVHLEGVASDNRSS